MLYGTQNDDRFSVASGGESVSAGNGQDRVVYDATGYAGGAITQTLDGGGGTDTLLVRLYKPQYDALRQELDDYAASLPREMNLVDRNFVGASNPLGLNQGLFKQLLDGTLTTGQNNQSSFFAFQSIGVKIKQFEALRFEIVNSAPIAEDDRVQAVEDVPLLIRVSDLLSNDTDADGNPLSITSVQGGANGTAELVTIDGVQHVRFIPAPDFNGEAGFSYTVSDGKGGTDTAVVTVAPAPANDAPANLRDADGAPNAVSEGAAAGTAVGFIALATDIDVGDALTYFFKVNDVASQIEAEGRFAIDAATGVVTVADPAKLDYESAKGHAVTVWARDAAGAEVAKDFAIAVTDAKEVPADATVLTFDGVFGLGDGGETAISASGAPTYGGFTWRQVGVYNPAPGDGLGYAATSGDTLAFIGEKNGQQIPGYEGEPGSPMVIQRADGADFSFYGAAFSAAHVDGVEVTARAYDDGALVGMLTFSVPRGAADHVDFGDANPGQRFTSIDRLEFDAPGYFGLDDFAFGAG